jgi:ABC-2 type transport system ATP-binding protein
MGTLPDLRSLLGERDLLRLSGRFEPNAVVEAMSRLEAIELVQVDAESMTLAVPEASTRLSAIFRSLAGAGAEIRETVLSQPSLESLFIKLTGKELRE